MSHREDSRASAPIRDRYTALAKREDATQNERLALEPDTRSQYRDRAEERRRGVINNDEFAGEGLHVQDVEDEDDDKIRIKGLDLAALQEKRRQDVEAEEAAKQAVISTYYNADNLQFSSTFARAVFRAGVEKTTYAAAPASLMAPLTSVDSVHDPDTTNLLSQSSDMAHRIALLHNRFAPGGTVFTLETNPYHHWTSAYTPASKLPVRSDSYEAYMPSRVVRAAHSRTADAKALSATTPAGVSAGSSTRSRNYNQNIRLAFPVVVAARVATAVTNREKAKLTPALGKPIPGLNAPVPPARGKPMDDDVDDIFGDSGGAYIPAHRQNGASAPITTSTDTTKSTGADAFDDDIFAGDDEWKPIGLGGKTTDGKKDREQVREDKKKGNDGRPVYSWLENEEDAYAELFPSFYTGESVDIKTLRAQFDDGKDAGAKGKKRAVDDDDDEDEAGGFEKELQTIGKRLNLDVTMDERASKRARILGKR